MIEKFQKMKDVHYKRILVVDDEEFCISTMEALLSLAGLEVNTQVDFAITGEEAINLSKLATQCNLNYKLIFTDFSMPIMDGIEATRQIRKDLNAAKVSREDQPIIIGITGHVHEEFKQQGIQAGMDEVLSKPVHF